ncbi:MAG: Sua5/YciO/YrdC/YwlC family protein, partial [Salinisphaeraceae bacterium]|nr:Sua5/YciO/YrdC/YwlC family protein [Salinisphaeraceae bacterium]
MTPWHLRCAVKTLRNGGLLAHPTEGVWGLACDPLNAHAVEYLLASKHRSARQGLILIAADFGQLRPYLGEEVEAMQSRILPTWPGPVTWILPAAAWVPSLLSGGRSTIAVRVTAHPVASALCAAFGDVLVSTSANRSGRPAALNSTAVRARLGDR